MLSKLFITLYINDLFHKIFEIIQLITHMKYLLTTNPGIEDIVIEEVKEKLKLKARQWFVAGRVEVESKKNIGEKLKKLRSIYHVIREVSIFEFESLNDIYEKVKKLSIKELEKANSFRVTGKRRGKHDFKSIDLQKVVGSAIVEKYGKKVDLKGYDVEILAEVYGNKCFIGVCLTDESLHKRFVKAFEHPAAIKMPLAYAMLKLAKIKKGQKLLDPFCGSGSIIIEAALVYGNSIKVYASDIEQKYIEGAKENAKVADVNSLINFKVANANKLDEYYESNFFDVIVTNPPYGIRLRKKHLKWLYRDFLETAHKVLKENGKIVVITSRANSFRDLIFKTKKYVLEHERVVSLATLWPHIFVLRKI